MKVDSIVWRYERDRVARGAIVGSDALAAVGIMPSAPVSVRQARPLPPHDPARVVEGEASRATAALGRSQCRMMQSGQSVLSMACVLRFSVLRILPVQI